MLCVLVDRFRETGPPFYLEDVERVRDSSTEGNKDYDEYTQRRWSNELFIYLLKFTNKAQDKLQCIVVGFL